MHVCILCEYASQVQPRIELGLVALNTCGFEIHVYVHTWVYVFTCTSVYMYINVYVCIYVYVYTHTYVPQCL
jgi:hypothetical protein